MDEARSGQTTANREQFRKMLEQALHKKRPFNRILVEHTSRIARNPREALDVFSLLTYYGINVSYVSQGIDTADATAEEMVTINGLIDSLYLRNLALETKRGLSGQVLKGFSGGGKRYGYYSEPILDGKVDIYGNPTAEGYVLRIHPLEADVVKRIYRMYGEEGLSARAIVSILNKELKETGQPKPPRNKFWSFTSILGQRLYSTGILNNQLYIGIYVWNRSTSKRHPETGVRRRSLRASDEWIVTIKPDLAIVSKDLWDIVKSRQKTIAITSAGKYTKSKASYSKNLLTGHIKCAICGGSIVIVSGGNRRGYYGCSSNWNKGESVCPMSARVDRDILESVICRMLPINSTNNQCLIYLRDKINHLLRKQIASKISINALAAIHAHLKKMEKEISNYVKAIGVGLNLDSITQALRNAEQKKAMLVDKIAQSSKTNNMSLNLSSKDIMPYLCNLRKTLKTNPNLGRQLLEKIIASGIFTHSSIRIHMANNDQDTEIPLSQLKKK
jgi:DNA invertase Pin-like site-specific DNA recombinase